MPSSTGRASAAIRPLTADVDGTLPTDLVVSGGGLVNAVCPLLTETRCAVGEPPGLGVPAGHPGRPGARSTATEPADAALSPEAAPLDNAYAVLMVDAQPTDDRIAFGTARGRWVLAATALGSGMAFLDGTVVNVALPAMG